MCLLGRHEAAGLGEYGDQRVLAQEGRFARHVGAGDQQDAPGLVTNRCVIGRRQVAIVGNERAAAISGQRLLDDGMAAADDLEGQVVGDMRAHIGALDGEFGEARVHVELAERRGGGFQRRAVGDDPLGQGIEDLVFQRHGAFGRGGDTAFQFGQLVG